MDIKKQILKAMRLALVDLENIPVKESADCQRKLNIRDNMIAAAALVQGLEILEKEETDADTGK